MHARHQALDVKDQIHEQTDSSHGAVLNAADFQRGRPDNSHITSPAMHDGNLDFGKHPLPGIDSAYPAAPQTPILRDQSSSQKDSGKSGNTQVADSTTDNLLKMYDKATDPKLKELIIATLTAQV